MKRSLVLLGTIVLFAFASEAQIKVNVTTFNMKWFGIGGNPNNVQKEYRLPTMKDFIAKYLNFTNVFVFEEVVDLATLNQILPPNWNCVGYKHPMPLHQYIAVCATPEISLEKVSYDTNYVIEEVAAESPRMRPAVRINVTERSSRRILFTLVGVHLKAMPEETKRRLLQSQAIAKDLMRVPAQIPVLITGDFNVYTTKETGLPQNDIDLIENALNSGARAKTYFHVDHRPNTMTFRSTSFRNQFDQFFVRGPIKVETSPFVFPVCSAVKDGQGYFNFSYYYKNVSDHCPTAVQVTVPARFRF